MTNLDSILESRDITLPTKVCLVKVMVFPVVMYGCESWTIKKTEHRRIDAFELWCWRRLLRVFWMDMNLNNLQELVTEQLSSFVQLCDSMDCSTPGLSVHYQLLGLTQTHVHRVSDAIQPSHPLSSPSPPTFNLSQHQSLFQ